MSRMSSNLAASVGSLRIKEPVGLSAYDSSDSLSELVNEPADRSGASRDVSEASFGTTERDNSMLTSSRQDSPHAVSKPEDSNLLTAQQSPSKRNGFSSALSPVNSSRAQADSDLEFSSGSSRARSGSRLTASDGSSESEHQEHDSSDYLSRKDIGSGAHNEALGELSLRESRIANQSGTILDQKHRDHSLSRKASPEPEPEQDIRESAQRSRTELSEVHSTVQKSRVRSSGSPGFDSSSFSHNTIGSKVLHSDEGSPLDQVDELLSGRPRFSSPMSQAARPTRFRSPLKTGMLSFDGYADTDGIQIDDELREGYPHESVEAGDRSLGGVRRNQGRARKLETENMELRLKLQQYREMNASEQEMSRVKYQVSRLERRIDELEEALERKNQTIRDLVEERDAGIHSAQSEQTKELYQTIGELQLAISTLEQESLQSEKEMNTALSQAHKEFPSLIPNNARVPDLVSALRHSLEENDELRSLAATASSLRSQQDSIRSLLSQLGHPGDPLTSIQEVVHELGQATKDSSAIRESMGRENWKLSREVDSLREAYMLKSREAADVSAKLRARSDTDLVTIRDLEEKLEDLERVLSESRSTSYSIVRRFFSQLFEVLGGDFQEMVEKELEEIMSRAKEEGLSKIPLLTDLLIKHARNLAEIVRASSSKPNDEHKIWALERELRSLEQILGMKWEKAGADAVLRAQVKDLRNQLKLEQEKRKSEWLEYERSVQKSRGTYI